MGIISIQQVIFNVVILLAPTIALGIAALVISSQHPDIICDGSMISLPLWLNVFGGVAIGIAIFLVLALVLYASGYDFGIRAYLGITMLYQCFMIAWNVTGTVALFRDSSECQKAVYPIWVMTLSVLIIQWIGFCLSWLGSVKVSNEE